MNKKPIPYGYCLLHDAPEYLVGSESVEQDMAVVSIKEALRLGKIEAKLYLDDPNGNFDTTIIYDLAQNFIVSPDLGIAFTGSKGWSLWNRSENNQTNGISNLSKILVDEKATNLFGSKQRIYARIYGRVIIHQETLAEFQLTCTGVSNIDAAANTQNENVNPSGNLLTTYPEKISDSNRIILDLAREEWAALPVEYKGHGAIAHLANMVRSQMTQDGTVRIGKVDDSIRSWLSRHQDYWRS